MTASESSTTSAPRRDLCAETERERAEALLGWEKEARTLAWFGLRDGMSLLELGCGSGFITEQLLAMLPNSPMTALEVDPDLICEAKQYLAGHKGDRLRFVEASATETGLPDESYDFAFARLVFHHLSDPGAAAKEILRVLKPGGKLALSDVDDGLWGIVGPAIPEKDTILDRVAQAWRAEGIDRYVGRRLWRILEGAGFVHLDLEAVVMHSDALGIEAFLPEIDPDELAPLVKAGLVSAQEMEQVRASHQAFVNAARPYVLRVQLLACGERP
jgi:SAM-dependent methyltransferase